MTLEHDEYLLYRGIKIAAFGTLFAFVSLVVGAFTMGGPLFPTMMRLSEVGMLIMAISGVYLVRSVLLVRARCNRLMQTLADNRADLADARKEFSKNATIKGSL